MNSLDPALKRPIWLIQNEWLALHSKVLGAAGTLISKGCHAKFGFALTSAQGTSSCNANTLEDVSLCIKRDSIGKDVVFGYAAFSKLL